MRNVLTALLLWAAGLGAAAQFGKMSVIYDALGEIYPVQRGVGIGIMVSVIGIVGLVFGVTAGGLITRIGPKRALLMALALGAAISLLQSLIPPYAIVLATRVPEGLSHLAIVIVGPTAIAATANPRFQGFVMTLWGSFFGVAFAMLAYFGPALVADQGPGRLFQLHALWLLLCLAALWYLMPADLRGQNVAPRLSLAQQHLAIYRSPKLAAPAMGFVFYTVTYVAILTLLPGAVQGDWSKFVAVAMPLVSIIVSLTLGVWLLGQMPAFRVVQFGFALAILAAILLWMFWGQGTAQAAIACLLSSAMGIVQGASFASIPQLNAKQADRALAAGGIAQLGNLGTTTGTPALALILAHAGPTGLMLFLVVFSALGILVHSMQAARRGTGAGN